MNLKVRNYLDLSKQIGKLERENAELEQDRILCEELLDTADGSEIMEIIEELVRIDDFIADNNERIEFLAEEIENISLSSWECEMIRARQDVEV